MAFDASLMNSAFAKLNEMLDEFRGRRPPLREHVGSDRRSLSAGPSDIDRPNPLAKVSDAAPQGPDMVPQGPDLVPQSPDVAPGPSTATYDPHGLGSSRYDAPRDDMFVSPRGGVDRGEHVRYGSRHVSPSRTPSHQERLRDELERTHAQISQIRDCNDYCRARGRAPPDHSYRDLEILQSRYAQLSLALEESLQDSSSGHRGRSPFIASHRVASPSDAPHPRRPDSSSLQRLRLSPRPSSSSQDRRVQGTPPAVFIITVAIHKSDIRTDSLLAPTLGTVGDPVQGGPLLLSDWISPQGSPPRGSTLLNSEWNSPQDGPPLQSEWNSLRAPGLATVRGPFQGIPLLQGDAPQGIPSLQGASPLRQSEWDSLRGIPLLPNDNDLRRGTLLLLDGSIHPELRLVRPHLRDPHRGLRLPILLHLREKIRKLKRRLCQPQLRP